VARRDDALGFGAAAQRSNPQKTGGKTLFLYGVVFCGP